MLIRITQQMRAASAPALRPPAAQSSSQQPQTSQAFPVPRVDAMGETLPVPDNWPSHMRDRFRQLQLEIMVSGHRGARALPSAKPRPLAHTLSESVRVLSPRSRDSPADLKLQHSTIAFQVCNPCFPNSDTADLLAKRMLHSQSFTHSFSPQRGADCRR